MQRRTEFGPQSTQVEGEREDLSFNTAIEYARKEEHHAVLRIFWSKAYSFKIKAILNPESIDENIGVTQAGSGWLS